MTGVQTCALPICIYELRNPIGYGVQVVKCKDLDEADAKAKEVLEAFFEDKVNIKGV